MLGDRDLRGACGASPRHNLCRSQRCHAHLARVSCASAPAAVLWRSSSHLQGPPGGWGWGAWGCVSDGVRALRLVSPGGPVRPVPSLLRGGQSGPQAGLGDPREPTPRESGGPAFMAVVMWGLLKT